MRRILCLFTLLSLVIAACSVRAQGFEAYTETVKLIEKAFDAYDAYQKRSEAKFTEHKKNALSSVVANLTALAATKKDMALQLSCLASNLPSTAKSHLCCEAFQSDNNSLRDK